MLTLLCGMETEAHVFQGYPDLQVLYGTARDTLPQLISKDSKGIVSSGTCGGLIPGYYRGDLVTANSIVTQDGTVYTPHMPWIHAVQDRIKIKQGRMFSAPNTITQTPAQRAVIAEKYFGDIDDEESWAVGQAAKVLNLPFIVLRAVSDQYDQTLLPDDATAVNPDGTINIWKEIPDFFEYPIEAITEAEGLNQALGALSWAFKELGYEFAFNHVE
jgi:hypothetical protein